MKTTISLSEDVWGIRVINTDDGTDLISDIGALSGDVLLTLLEASPNSIALLDLEGRVAFMNARGMTALGLDTAASVKGTAWLDLWPQEHQTKMRAALKKATKGTACRFVVTPVDGGATAPWWDIRLEPTRSDGCKDGIIVAIAQDVTHLHRPVPSPSEKLMLSEIDHRVKNNLAMIAAVLRLQIKSTDSRSARNDLEDAANRILTVSQVHAELYRAPKQDQVALSDYLCTLSKNLVEAIGGPNIALTLATEPMSSDAKTAQALGLILTEVLSNAIRHAFPEMDSGRILIELRAVSKTQTRLCVYDDGIGLPENFTLDGQTNLGSKIIALYAAKIGATVRATSSDAGSEFEIIF